MLGVDPEDRNVPTSREQVVERQVQAWLAQRRGSGEGVPSDGPVVTLSRTRGSLGDEVAVEVAQVLGWEVWDRKLVEAIAERARVEPSLVRATEAREIRLVRQVAETLLGNPALEPSVYLRQLGEIVALLAAHGRAVLVGRGTNFLLGPKQALRVRVDAPRALRVARVAGEGGIPERDAEEEVRQEDQRRTRWVEGMFNRDPREPTAYDVTLCTEAWTPAEAAGVVVAAWQERRAAWRREQGT